MFNVSLMHCSNRGYMLGGFVVVLGQYTQKTLPQAARGVAWQPLPLLLGQFV